MALLHRCGPRRARHSRHLHYWVQPKRQHPGTRVREAGVAVIVAMFGLAEIFTFIELFEKIARRM
jgi:hypothetical protein